MKLAKATGVFFGLVGISGVVAIGLSISWTFSLPICLDDRFPLGVGLVLIGLGGLYTLRRR